MRNQDGDAPLRPAAFLLNKLQEAAQHHPAERKGLGGTKGESSIAMCDAAIGTIGML